MKHYRIIAIMLLAAICTADVMAQSAIYVCGHFRRQRPATITRLRNSGYTTAIIFNIDVQEDGTLTTDYDWNNKQPAEAGGIICQDGKYVFDKYQPYYVSDVKMLLKAPTSINRIEICIGGWGNGSYGKIKNIIAREGTGENSMLYKNFKALKEMLPEITAVNNDQEQDYDVATAVSFHTMMHDLGYKTTIAPYMNQNFWQAMVRNLNNARPGACELVYLQTYGGGAYNNPADWNFGDIPLWVGFDCESSGDMTAMETKFKNLKANTKASGGFLWNYNSEARVLNDWATAINRIFTTRTVDQNSVAAIAYSDADYKGYAIQLEEGVYTMADLAAIGLKARDMSSMKVSDGYRVSLYKGTSAIGTSLNITTSTPYIGDAWNDAVSSMRIEHTANGIKTAHTRQDSNDTPIYNIAGQKVDASYKGLKITKGRKTVNINR